MENRYKTELDMSVDNSNLIAVNEWDNFLQEKEYDSQRVTGFWVKDGFVSNDEVFETSQEDATHVVYYIR